MATTMNNNSTSTSNNNNNNNNSNSHNNSDSSNGEGDQVSMTPSFSDFFQFSYKTNEPCVTAVNLLKKELGEITKNPPPNCTAGLKEDDLFIWSATILGPSDSVYADGIFDLEICFPFEYPYRPPQVGFKTKIYHCNISSDGIVCVDILRDKWSPALGVSALLLSITSLLTDCNPYDPMELSIAAEYITSRQSHDKTARAWVKKYAQ